MALTQNIHKELQRMVSIAAMDEIFQGKTTTTKGQVDLLNEKFHGDGNGSDSKIISFCELLVMLCIIFSVSHGSGSR